MGYRLDGRLSLICIIITFLCLEDSSLFQVIVAAHARPGSVGRIQKSVSNSTKNGGDEVKTTPSQENQSIPTPLAAYRSNAELLAAMRDYVSRCSNISRLYTIGESVKGVPLMVLEISDFPGRVEAEPAFKYVGNMHGDEPTGRELTLYLAEWLCTNYLKDPQATLIVQRVHLHLLPSMNPDGFESKTRNNANDIDLNRDFPDQYVPLHNNESGRQPETLAIMRWVRNIPFTASASLHEGALVASYGWDGTLTGRAGYSESPDDAGFRYLASLYAQSNPVMKTSSEFLGGITNGAAWYPLYGGMQDWNYIHGNCFEITLEVNDAKWPNISKLPELWQQHQQSMLDLVAIVAKSGVHGRVFSSSDGKPLAAIISVKGIDHTVNATATLGDYHRILPPGKNYELTAKFPGYISRQTTVVLSQWKATTLDFVLDPVVPASQSRPKVDCGDGELAFHCAENTQAGVDTLGLRDSGIQPWLPRKLATSFDRHDMASLASAELFVVVSAGTIVVAVSAVLFVLMQRRRYHRSWSRNS